MGKVRYGIIGSGMMGQEHMRNIALLPGTAVTAVADPDEGMRESAARLGGNGTMAFADYRDLLSADLCDAFVVAAPNHEHVAVMRDLIALGKPVLCEKPLCTTVADCGELARKAAAAGTPVWVAMEYRYIAPVARLVEEVRSGTIGRLRMLAIREHRYPFLHKVGNWNRFNEKSGGTLVEKCCHFFDLMRLVVGAEATRVYASGGMDVNFLEESYDGRSPDVLDNAFVVVDFDNGVRAALDLCMFAEGSTWQEVIAATGDRAKVEAFVPGPARFSRDGRERVAEIAISPRETKLEQRLKVDVDATILAAGDHHGSTFYQHQRFLDLVRHGGKPEVTLDDGTKAVAIGAAAETSVRTGRVISL
jgi:predicted dehydrogenase